MNSITSQVPLALQGEATVQGAMPGDSVPEGRLRLLPVD